MKFGVAISGLFGVCCFALAAGDEPQAQEKNLSWKAESVPVERDIANCGAEALAEKPEFRDVTEEFLEAKVEGLRSVSFDPLPSSCPKRIEMFAYLGIPDGPAPAGGFPAVVFGHGGQGCANAVMVLHWKKLGYVALSMACEKDACKTPGAKEPLKLKGFPGLDDYSSHIGVYVRANSLLRGLPEVNKDKIAYVGQSWGAVKGAALACVDARFKCVILDSGAGYWQVGDKSLFWFNTWRNNAKLEPARHFSQMKAPCYWFAGSNDKYCGTAAWEMSVEATPSLANQLMLYEYPHARLPARQIDRILDFELKGGAPLPKLGPSKLDGLRVSAKILCEGKGVVKAALFSTCGDGPFAERKWKIENAAIEDGVVSAKAPEGSTQFFLAIFDEIGDFERIGRENGDYVDKFCGSSSTIFTFE